MSGYYDDEDKLTFDEAECLVEKYVQQYKTRRTHVKGSDIIQWSSYSETMHNRYRISAALEEKLPLERGGGSRTRIYRIEHDG